MLQKLNGNHLLMVNNFKLHEYQAFGLLKMHNFPILNLVYEKVWFTINGSNPCSQMAIRFFKKLKLEI